MPKRPAHPTRRSSSARKLVEGAVVAAAAGVAVIPTPSAEAGTTSKLQELGIGVDRFYNYDFNQQEVDGSRVDWPVNLFFWNNAEIDKVKDGLDFFYGSIGGSKYMKLRDGTTSGEGYVWDSDKGRKSAGCLVVGTATHYRIYADHGEGQLGGADRMYDPGVGYYVVGTSHKDRNECGFGSWSGESEEAEGEISTASRAVWGTSNVYEDYANFYNQESYRVEPPVGAEKEHRWRNGGYASYVRVT